MLDGDGRELVERKLYYVQQFESDGEVGPWNVGRWEGWYGWTVLGDRIGFGVVTVGSRVPMPDEKPEDVYVEDCHDGWVTLWHDSDKGFSELTPAQARTLAAHLVETAGGVEARDVHADEPAPEPDQPACLDDHPQYGKKERKTP